MQSRIRHYRKEHLSGMVRKGFLIGIASEWVATAE
jgi:hypothetical protein